MLILTRKEGETIVIGDDISITVLTVKSAHQVKIGIHAPDDKAILREELTGKAALQPPLHEE